MILRAGLTRVCSRVARPSHVPRGERPARRSRLSPSPLTFSGPSRPPDGRDHPDEPGGEFRESERENLAIRDNVIDPSTAPPPPKKKREGGRGKEREKEKIRGTAVVGSSNLITRRHATRPDSPPTPTANIDVEFASDARSAREGYRAHRALLARRDNSRAALAGDPFVRKKVFSRFSCWRKIVGDRSASAPACDDISPVSAASNKRGGAESVYNFGRGCEQERGDKIRSHRCPASRLNGGGVLSSLDPHSGPFWSPLHHPRPLPPPPPAGSLPPRHSRTAVYS